MLEEGGEENVPPLLTNEDRVNLGIRWDLGDRIYVRRRQEAFERCKALGCDLEKASLELGRLDDALKVVGELVYQKVEIDKSCVLRAGARLCAANRREIGCRLRQSFFEARDLLRIGVAIAISVPLELPSKNCGGLIIDPKVP
jgi:hypothetical protein